MEEGEREGESRRVRGGREGVMVGIKRKKGRGREGGKE